MSESFEKLLEQLAAKRPTQRKEPHWEFFFKDHKVQLLSGEMEDVAWVDIQITLPRFKLTNLASNQKVLKANLEMGAATPIPTWFAADANNQVVFINRLDWRHLTADVLDDHISRCIEQMSEALATEGV